MLMNFKSFAVIGRSIALGVLVLSCQVWVRQLSAKAQSPTLSSREAFASKQAVKQQSYARNICPAQLGQAIDAIANRPEYRRYRWGMLIQTLSSSQILYSRDAQQYFTPASNVKLFTTAVALNQLGSQFRIRTSVYGSNGVLRVVGRGDPSLTDAQLKDLAQQLKRQGISQVQQLIVHDDYFQGPIVNVNWQWEDVASDYGAPVNSLILNQNAIEMTLLPQKLGQPLKFTWNDPLSASQWQVENFSVTAKNGSESTVAVTGVLGKPVLQIWGELAANSEPEPVGVAVRDPAENFLRHFQTALESEGISIAQTMLAPSQKSADEPELAAVESPPLSQLLIDTNQPSNNLYAEVLLRTIGAIKKSDIRNQNTAEMGLEVLKKTLTDLGVEPESYVIEDGSGLSRHNLVSPLALVQLLKAMAQSPQAEIYRASLPVAGVSGTLKNRFKNTAAQGIVLAKTGTLGGVSTLSGYVDVPGYETVIFSIMLNQYDRPAKKMRPAIDEIVLLLSRLRRC
ncbi:D-alanyl-D-alanine carboxypeptidase/D-alanyl-D-alanine endopeptidase [Aerosakkonema funiforme]